MKFLPLLWSNLMRRKFRTICTTLSILFAFVLIGALLSIRAGFSRGVDVTGADRLVVSQKTSMNQPMPLAYRDRLASIPGVAAVTYAGWFRGIYQNPKNAFPQLAVDTDTWFEMYRDLWTVPDDQLARWKADRIGAIVGSRLIERFGWKIGDRIPLQSAMWPKAGGGAWEFIVDGVYSERMAGKTSRELMFFHYTYLNDARALGRDLVDWYRVRVTNPAHANEVAQAIDVAFANSAFETTTSTENAFVRAIAEQIGDVGAIVIAILGPVLFTIVLVCGNTMAQAIRERRTNWPFCRRLGLPAVESSGWCSSNRSCCPSWPEQSVSVPGCSSNAQIQRGCGSDGAVVAPQHRARRPVRGTARSHRGHRPDVARASPRPRGRLATRGLEMWTQTLAVTYLNLASIPRRLGSSAVAVFGIAGVVVVLVGILSIGRGFQRAMSTGGDPLTAIVLPRVPVPRRPASSGSTASG